MVNGMPDMKTFRPHIHLESLRRFHRVLPALVAGLHDDQWRFRPSTGKWSILEIVCHLADEEVEDFRPRLERTLADPIVDWSPIDPAAAAIQRAYQSQSPPGSLARFLDARAHSIEWLDSLRDADWHRAYPHPKLGPLPAGDLLTAWAAHDLLHLRQFTKRLYEQVGVAGGSFSHGYAGTWQESGGRVVRLQGGFSARRAGRVDRPASRTRDCDGRSGFSRGFGRQRIARRFFSGGALGAQASDVDSE